MAIRVMCGLAHPRPKYSVQTTLKRKFRKYIVYKKHNNSLIMHTLQQMVKIVMNVEQMRNGARGKAWGGHRCRFGRDPEDDLLMRMRSLTFTTSPISWSRVSSRTMDLVRQDEADDFTKLYESKYWR